jgi:hypothetical protein
VDRTHPFPLDAHLTGVQRISDAGRDIRIQKTNVVHKQKPTVGSRKKSGGELSLAGCDCSLQIQPPEQAVFGDIQRKLDNIVVCFEIVRMI